ncbi:MAG: cysteine desulfurase [Chlamydiae bacterium]|nr:MAG: cysteine desulfurase [Chlamydiota bacterium]
MISTAIYLDNNATTSLAQESLDALIKESTASVGNPSSIHRFGQAAKKRLQGYRDTIATYLAVASDQIIFTSGGTESMNLLIYGMLENRLNAHVITSDVEHACIYNTLTMLQKRGTRVSFLQAGLHGAVHPDQIEKAILPSTRMIVLSAVNSETGVKTDIDAIAQIAKKNNIVFIVDAVALLGKETFSIPSGVSAMGFSGHKLHAPKGIGCVFIRPELDLYPFITGGSQEFNRRSGTQNLSGIAAMAAAVECLYAHLPSATEKMAALRDQLEASLIEQAAPVIINGSGKRICNTSNLCFPGVQGEDLIIALDMRGVAVSHGSACSSGALEPSRILVNMGISHPLARSSIRISLSRMTTEEEIQSASLLIAKTIKDLRS